MRQFNLPKVMVFLKQLWTCSFDYLTSYPRPTSMAKIRKSLEAKTFFRGSIYITLFFCIAFYVALFATYFQENPLKNFSIINIIYISVRIVTYNLDLFIVPLIIILCIVFLLIFLKNMAQADLIREYAVLRQRAKHQEPPSPPGFTLRHTLRGHVKRVDSLTWSPDGLLLASGALDDNILLWDTQSAYLRHTLTGHSGRVYGIAWSPNGLSLASVSLDATVRLWNTQTGQLLLTRDNSSRIGYSVAWSPDGHILASGSADKVIRFWNTETGQLLRTCRGHADNVYDVAWSPNGRMLASGSADKTVRLWDAETGQLLRTCRGHSKQVRGVEWSPNGLLLASCSDDATIRFWDPITGQHRRTIEGHTEPIYGISFSSDGHFLASKSRSGIVRLWRSDTQDVITVLYESSTDTASLAFHPSEPLLATLSKEDSVIRIWELNFGAIDSTISASSLISYTNAKVVLVGDSGVGKSGLGLVLAGKKYVPTDSTHSRRVWNFDNQEVDLDTVHKEVRETLLWDMAGQPGYRLIHQLYLNDVEVALVVFDTRSEIDPFAGVQHWKRALSQAQRVQESSALPLKKFLVAARIDRGGISVSPERIQSLVRELGFDGYFQTSAREGWGINELREAIREAIDWDTLPRVNSTQLFHYIKLFLVGEKETGRILSTADDLYSTFLKSKNEFEEAEDLHEQFETGIGRVESAGLIKRLSFGRLILLQPELLDAYASALINAVKDEPDGLGSIAEDQVRMGNFRMSADERIKDKEQEKLLLIAMIEDLLRRELALREEAFLIFPSQSTRENPDLPDPKGKTVTFELEGAVLNIYVTLAVRLASSGLFRKRELWKNAITYTANAGGLCGMFLHNIREGYGNLTLFFEKTASEETRLNFEDYIQLHLQRKVLPGSLKRRRIFTCNGCNFLVTDQLIQIRSERGFNWLDCPGCGKRIMLLDHDERLMGEPSLHVLEMDRIADNQRDLEAINP